MKNLSLTKKLLILLAGLVVLWVASAFFLGKKMQSKLEDKLTIINNKLTETEQGVQIRIDTLSSGIFTSELALYFEPTQKDAALEEPFGGLKKEKPLKIQVEHGPLLGIFSDASLQTGLGYARITNDDFLALLGEEEKQIAQQFGIELSLGLVRGFSSQSEVFTATLVNATNKPIAIPMQGSIDFSHIKLSAGQQDNQILVGFEVPRLHVDVNGFEKFSFKLDDLNMDTIVGFKQIPTSLATILPELKNIDIDYQLNHVSFAAATPLSEALSTLLEIKEFRNKGQISIDEKDNVRLLNANDFLYSIEKLFVQLPNGVPLIDVKVEASSNSKNMYVPIMQANVDIEEFLQRAQETDPMQSILSDMMKSAQLGLKYDEKLKITSLNGNGSLNIEYLLETLPFDESVMGKGTPDDILKNVLRNANVLISLDKPFLQHNLNHLAPIAIQESFGMPVTVAPEKTQEAVNAFVESTLKALPLVQNQEKNISVHLTFDEKQGLNVNGKAISIMDLMMNPSLAVDMSTLPRPEEFIQIFVSGAELNPETEKEGLEEPNTAQDPSLPSEADTTETKPE